MSSVGDVTYSAERKELRIVIGGALFVHRDVPSQIHAALVAADNRAQYYAAHIRDVFPRV
jgi:hypothetical protein